MELEVKLCVTFSNGRQHHAVPGCTAGSTTGPSANPTSDGSTSGPSVNPTADEAFRNGGAGGGVLGSGVDAAVDLQEDVYGPFSGQVRATLDRVEVR
jgi:hypothetical protein